MGDTVMSEVDAVFFRRYRVMETQSEMGGWGVMPKSCEQLSSGGQGMLPEGTKSRTEP